MMPVAPVALAVPFVHVRVARPHPVLVPRRRGMRGMGTVTQVLPAGTVATIAGAIQTQEGYYPGSLAWQNNNPGNLVYAGQPGAVRGAGGFAQFESYQDGLNALYTQIQLYAGRGMTINQMMNVYAPASAGNNPTAYASTVAGALGVSPDTSLADLSGLQSSSPSTYTNAYSDVMDIVGLPGMDPAAVGGIAAGLAVLAGLFLFSD